MSLKVTSFQSQNVVAQLGSGLLV